MTWYYNETQFTQDDIPEKCIGFVYEITNNTNGKKYIGKKKFTRTIKKRSVKKKRAVRVSKTSDWDQYYGSNLELQAESQRLGPDQFTRKILRLCYSLGEMSYYEMKEQIERDVLLKPDEYYNAFVGGKIHRKHLSKLINHSS